MTRARLFIFTVFISFGLFFSLVVQPHAAEELDEPAQWPLLTLSQAVTQALEANRELRAVRSDANASDFGRWEAISGFLPQLSFSSNVNKSQSERFQQRGASPNLPPEFADLFNFEDLGFTGANYTNTFQVNQLIYDRSVIGNIRLASLRNMAADRQIEGQEQAVVFNTVAGYLDLLQAKELLEVQRQRLHLAEEQLRTAQASFDVGLRIRTDVLRADLASSSAMRDVVSSEIALERAQVTLNNIMGVDLRLRHNFDSGDLSDYEPPRQLDRTLQDYSALFSIAEQQNPTIHIAALLVAQSEEAVNTARGEFYPRMFAGGSWGYNEQGRFDLSKEEWRLFAGVEIPIFEGGRRIAKVRRSHEELSAQEQRSEDAVRNVLSAVEQAALFLQEEMRNLEIAEKAVVVARENHERFLHLYEEGLSESLDVTQALTELVEAETNVVATRYGYLRMYAQLIQALGVIPVQGDAYTNNDWLSVLQN